MSQTVIKRLPFDAAVFKEVIHAMQPSPRPEIIKRAQRWLTRERRRPSPSTKRRPRPHLQPFPSMQEIEKMGLVNAIVTKYLMAYAKKMVQERTRTTDRKD